MGALEDEPGTGFTYSNSHYVLLAEVVASASGQPLAEYLGEHVFDPLALDMILSPGLT